MSENSNQKKIVQNFTTINEQHVFSVNNLKIIQILPQKNQKKLVQQEAKLAEDNSNNELNNNECQKIDNHMEIQRIEPQEGENSINPNLKEASQTIDQSGSNRIQNGGSAQKQKGPSSCNCKKSKCLKMYCQCYAGGSKCAQTCKCQNCQNIKNNLNSKDGKIQEQVQKQSEQVKKNKSPKDRFCNCKKSFCLKKYCECFTNGVACSQLCKCEVCKNTTDQHSHQNNPLASMLGQIPTKMLTLSSKMSAQQNNPKSILQKGGQQAKRPKQKWQQQQIQSKIAQIMKLVPQQHQQSMLDFLVYMLS